MVDHKRITMPYSFIDPEGRRVSGVAPTEEMPAAQLTPVATVKNIVQQIAERSIKAWMALPDSVRDLMLTSPDKFFLVPNLNRPTDVPKVVYQGVELMWLVDHAHWILADIKG